MKLGVPWTSKGKKRQQPPAAHDRTDPASVHHRLDDLSRQLERLSRITAGRIHPQGAPPAGPSHAPPLEGQPPPQQPVRAARGDAPPPQEVERYAGERTLNRNPLRPVYSQAALDQAMAEIVTRQRALDTTLRNGPRLAPDMPDTPVPPPEPPPSQNLTGLEKQLRQITTEIESLRRPCSAEEAVPALRQELSEIGRAVAEAMPRRAIEAIEADIRSLSERLDQSRRSGIERADLANLERGLAEVRDTVRGLRPAESLAGLQETVQGLNRKIDSLAANQQDPMALQQLGSAITGLRSVVAHVASDDTLARLTEEVRGIAQRVERSAATAIPSDALVNLERQIVLVVQALKQSQARDQQGPARIETMVHGLTEKIEKMQPSRGDTIAFGQLEERIAKLVEKLDVSGSRLGQLEAIERGLADVLVHLEEGARAGALRTTGSDSGLESLKHDLETVNDTLSRIGERLTTIESGMRANRPQAAAAEPPSAPVASTPAPTPVQPAQTPATKPPAAYDKDPPAPAPAMPVVAPSERLAAAANMQRPAPMPRERPPIDPSLPPDHPIEPGAAANRPPSTPAERIAASEAVLEEVKPSNPDSSAKADFVAAARRAAQAATQQADEPHNAGDGSDDSSLGNRFAGRVRSVLVGASVVVLTLGAAHVTMMMMEQYPIAIPGLAPESTEPATAPESKQSAKAPEILPPQKSAARILPDPAVTGSTPPREQAQTPAAVGPTPSLFDNRIWTSPLPPQTQASQGAPDITGALPKPDRPAEGSATPVPPNRPIEEGQTPAEPKSRLALAAETGDPAAAYELGVRHIEGRGVTRSYEEAARWLALAAKAELAPAQFRLGSLNEKGLGVKKDLSVARRLYAAAAAKGNAKAMHNLAVLYAEGVEGKPDYKTAVDWFRKAADRGVADSQYNLGVLYARGVGLEQNLAESYKWFALAAQGGDQEAGRKRDEIGALLDPDSLMAARLALKTWTAKPQPKEATTVATPPGGWDQPAAAPAAKRRARDAAPMKLGPS